MLESVVTFIKKHKILIISCAIFFIIFVPCSINLIYMAGKSLETNTYFFAGDLLSYWGSVLSFIGTVLLSVIALIQNERLNNTNILLSKFQMENLLPSFLIESFVETEAPSSRLLDTTNSVLYSKNSYINFSSNEQRIEYEYMQNLMEEELKELGKRQSQEPFTPELEKEMSDYLLKSAQWHKSLPSTKIEEYHDICWFISETKSQIDYSPSKYQKIVFKTIFKNSSESKITKVKLCKGATRLCII